jgi:GT2 family glycosyltransferase
VSTTERAPEPRELNEHTPFVRSVTVNFNGGQRTIDCLESILGTEWPAERHEVVLVDNASDDGVVARVRRELPSVRIVESPRNVGFGAGCNLGMRSLGDADFIALINNDVIVPPGWLRPLVQAATADATIGAASPKMLLERPYREIRIEVTKPGPASRKRDVGVEVLATRVGDQLVESGIRFRDGVWGPERAGATVSRWTRSSTPATVLVPLPSRTDESTITLELRACEPTTVRLTSGDALVDASVGPAPAWYDVPESSGTVDIINNAGSMLTPDLYGADRGYLEVDRGQFDAATDVFAWSGGAVLLRSSYLRDVGLFDEQLFLYYEDLELSWRGRERGWRYRYVPSSVVRHAHSASTTEGSVLAEYYNERNRLLVLLEHAPNARVRTALARYLAITASYARRDLAALFGERCIPDRHHTSVRLRAFGSFLRLAPGVWAGARRERRASTGQERSGSDRNS